MKKINIKKIVGWSIFVLVIFWLIRFGDFGTSEVKKDPLPRESSSLPPAPVPTPPAQPDTGWKTATGEAGYFWVTPEDSSKSTANLNINPQEYTSTYRILNTCVQQFTKKDGTVIAAFKADVDNRANYLETPTGSGKFASEPWPKTEHTKAWKQAEYVSFRPLNEPLDLKVGRMR